MDVRVCRDVYYLSRVRCKYATVYLDLQNTFQDYIVLVVGKSPFEGSVIQLHYAAAHVRGLFKGGHILKGYAVLREGFAFYGFFCDLKDPGKILDLGETF